MTEPNRQKYDPSTWVDEHGDALFRFALLRVKDETVAEDLVQETLLSALKGIDRFKGGSSLRTWLVGILKHKIIDQYRRNRPEVLSSDLASEDGESGEARLERSRDEGAPLISTWTDSPGKLLENKEFWQIFLRCHPDESVGYSTPGKGEASRVSRGELVQRKIKATRP